MIKYLNAIVLTTFFAPLASAQSINLQSTEFDFGNVRRGEKVVHEFQFSNTGSNDLIIRKINSSCGCIAAVADNATISPGSQSSIRVTFDTAGFSGKKLKTIRIYSNDSSNSSIVLKIGGEVVPEIVPVPEKLELTEIKKNQTKTAEVTLKQLWGTEVKIVEVISKSPYLTASLNKNNSIIEVKTKPETPLGIIQTRISIKTDSKTTPTINVPITIEVTGNLEIVPKMVNLGLIDTNKSYPVRRIKISRKDGEDIADISTIYNEDHAVSIEVEPRTDKKSIILVLGLRNKLTPIIRGNFKFKIEEDEIEYSIPYYGVVDGL